MKKNNLNQQEKILNSVYNEASTAGRVLNNEVFDEAEGSICLIRSRYFWCCHIPVEQPNLSFELTYFKRKRLIYIKIDLVDFPK